jgi:hypothetical protein
VEAQELEAQECSDDNHDESLDENSDDEMDEED